jgi:hypothetical protein
MLREAKNEDLVFAVDGCGGTCVFAYRSRKYVGAINAYGSAVCFDQLGNVFLPDQTTVTAAGRARIVHPTAFACGVEREATSTPCTLRVALGLMSSRLRNQESPVQIRSANQ